MADETTRESLERARGLMLRHDADMDCRDPDALRDDIARALDAAEARGRGREREAVLAFVSDLDSHAPVESYTCGVVHDHIEMGDHWHSTEDDTDV